jgi:hypothetical protein
MLLLSSVHWGPGRETPPQPPSPWTLALAALLLMNFLAPLAFATRWRPGWVLLLIVQAVDVVVFALFLWPSREYLVHPPFGPVINAYTLQLVSPGVCAAIAIVLLFLFRYATGRS